MRLSSAVIGGIQKRLLILLLISLQLGFFISLMRLTLLTFLRVFYYKRLKAKGKLSSFTWCHFA